MHIAERNPHNSVHFQHSKGFLTIFWLCHSIRRKAHQAFLGAAQVSIDSRLDVLAPKDRCLVRKLKLNRSQSTSGRLNYFSNLRCLELDQGFRLPHNAARMKLLPVASDSEVVEWVKDGFRDEKWGYLRNLNEMFRHWSSLVAREPKRFTLLVVVRTSFSMAVTGQTCEVVSISISCKHYA